jgi:peptidoglycan/LPS O-acetylase OafA/YrhL
LQPATDPQQASLTPSTASKPHTDYENPGGFEHIPALDGIRGLAILLVLFDHLFWANSKTGNRLFDTISALRASSYIGVQLFFALSGFLITGILLNTLHIRHFFKTFYARRTLRIFPLYYGFLFLLFALTRPLGFHWNGWQYFFVTYTANLALTYSHPRDFGLFNINHFWSLQVEEQFYLVWPLIVYKVRNLQSLIRLCLITCGVVLLIRVGFVLALPYTHDPYRAYSPTFCCMDNLLFGCCLAALLRTNLRERVLALAPRVALVCTVIMVAMGLRPTGLDFHNSTIIPTLGFSTFGIAATALIAMALKRNSRTQNLFTNSGLRFFGKYSYGLYVYHYSMSGFLTPPLRTWLDGHLHSKTVAVIVGAIVVGVASTFLAMLSYHLYEVHFLKLKKYFSYNQGGKLQNTSTVA